MLKEGDKAPDFTLPDDEGNPVSLKSLRGKTVVLYVYPKDNTPGCTQESCDFRDSWARFRKKDVVVLGLSKDSPASKKKFKAKYGFPFPLLADEDLSVLKAYGVYREKTMYGKKMLGIVRSTFVIDPKGVVAKIYDKVKVAGHAAEVFDFVA